MGAEATCTARFEKNATRGKARLETDALRFRGGEIKLSIPFKQMSKVIARGGRLSVTFPGAPASFEAAGLVDVKVVSRRARGLRMLTSRECYSLDQPPGVSPPFGINIYP